MNDDELAKLIIKELSRHHDRNEIISKVCDQSALTWGEAERLIANVEAQNKRKIAARQSPFLVLLSIGTLILGIWLLAYNIQFLLSFPQKDMLEQILSLRSGYYRIAGLITGAVMTIGGLYGAWKTLAALFPDS